MLSFNSFISKVLVSEKTLEGLLKLAQYPDETHVVKTILETRRKYLFSSFIRFWLDSALYVITVFFILFYDFFKSIFIDHPVQIFTAVILFAFLNYYFRIINQHNTNIYYRYVSDLLDDVLRVIFSRNRNNLSQVLHEIPDVKEISRDLGVAGFRLQDLVSSASSVFSVCITSAFLLFLFVISREPYYLISSLFIFTIILSLGLILYLGSKFQKKSSNYEIIRDELDKQYKDSDGLIVDIGLRIDESSVPRLIRNIVSTTDAINSMTFFTLEVLTLLLIVTRIFLPNDSHLLEYILLVTLTAPRVFSSSSLISTLRSSQVAIKRNIELNQIVKNLLKLNSVLTSEIYLDIQNRFLNMRFDKDISKSEKEFNIKDLQFNVGRGHPYSVKIKDMKLERGGVYVLSAPSGAGKSMFGRILTLSYPHFSAEYLGFEKDIREHSSLFEGRKYYRFSSLRPIDTSYRAALSVYLASWTGKNQLLDIIISNPMIDETDDNCEMISYMKAEGIYNQLKNNRFTGITDLFEFYDRIVKSTEYETFSHYLYQAMKYSNSSKKLKKVLMNCKEELGVESCELVEEMVFRGIVTGYYHLKKYIPEASLFFMDAILSEPPISQGQRRRVLYALDILCVSDLFILDEPFANLDPHASSIIMEDLIKVAEEKNCAVLILDQATPDHRTDRDFLKEIHSSFVFVGDESNGYAIVENQA